MTEYIKFWMAKVLGQLAVGILIILFCLLVAFLFIQWMEWSWRREVKKRRRNHDDR